MTFDNIVGQSNAIKNLKSAISNNRIAHAYLFTGPDGVGKSIAAFVLAMTLNCREKGDNPCGICPSCIRAKAGSHPDIIDVKTQKSSISVDDIRELQRDMQKKPYEKGIKVYIIHQADKMTDQAQNSLLKTLEEPPSYVIIILLSENQYSLLNTIRSRCQVIKFVRASERDVESYLIRKGIPMDEARYISAFSEGIVKKAEDFLKDEAFKKSRDEIINMARELCRKDKIHALSYVDYFMNNKDKIHDILGLLMSYFRDILIYKECGNDNYIINLDKSDIIMEESSRLSYTNLSNIVENIKKTMDNIKSNANYQLSIEMMLLHIQEG